MKNASQLPDPVATAEKLLAKAKIMAPPVDLTQITSIWSNLFVVEEELDGSGYLLPVGELGAEILVNRSDKEERKRFTIAHELGHWVLGLALKKKTGHFSKPRNAHYVEIERWCDRFATNLLMPESMIRVCASQCEDVVDFVSLTNGPSRFNVSEHAFFLRIWEVLRLQVALISLTFGPARTFAHIEKSFGDPQVQVALENALRMPDLVSQLLMRPSFSFSWSSTDGKIKCSGRRIKVDQVLLAFRWPENDPHGQ